jgi:hypothetical protein
VDQRPALIGVGHASRILAAARTAQPQYLPSRQYLLALATDAWGDGPSRRWIVRTGAIPSLIPRVGR